MSSVTQATAAACRNRAFIEPLRTLNGQLSQGTSERRLPDTQAVAAIVRLCVLAAETFIEGGCIPQILKGSAERVAGRKSVVGEDDSRLDNFGPALRAERSQCGS